MITMRDALGPVTEALLRQARLDADAVAGAAEREAARTVAEARREASAVIADATRQGEAEAEAHAAAARARARREARGRELAARREVLADLRGRVAAAVRALRDDPCYPRLVEHLGELAREAGGADLVVREHPDGGVVAEGPGRRVDCSLTALAERAVDALGAEVERLWAP
ncbi:V-type ATP synthase subunit E family protein [Microbispora amethystogenes]|uniref:V-type ATP synthase subunit E family protein n=1 Tax=Microbispora amethystogenes TaxID=1427754 RepID=UPI0034013003